MKLLPETDPILKWEGIYRADLAPGSWQTYPISTGCSKEAYTAWLIREVIFGVDSHHDAEGVQGLVEYELDIFLMSFKAAAPIFWDDPQLICCLVDYLVRGYRVIGAAGAWGFTFGRELPYIYTPPMPIIYNLPTLWVGASIGATQNSNRHFRCRVSYTMERLEPRVWAAAYKRWIARL